MENQKETREISFKQAQNAVEEWVSNPNFKIKYFPPFQILGQLMEELGEVSREVAHIHGHKKKKEGEKTDGLECEIGDVIFGLICLANSEDVSLEKCFKKSMEKKWGRDNERFLKTK